MGEKREHLHEGASDLQEGNRQWFQEHPPNMDWRKQSLTASEGTPEYFAEVDRRFIEASPFFAGARPFGRLIPYESLSGKRVLEIGCGLGTHTEFMAEAGARVSAIDLTSGGVELTRRRLALRGLDVDVRIMDGEELQFDDEEFDLVWSWGVVQHTAHPERLAREAHRVLKGSGEFRLMVYNSRSMHAVVNVVRGTLSGKPFLGFTVPDMLSHYSDGYVARWYNRPGLARLLHEGGFASTRAFVLGPKGELILLPRRWNRLAARMVAAIPDAMAEAVLARVGSWLFTVATKGGSDLGPTTSVSSVPLGR
jgi:2-polyprenyl-3-methyl-5-hydroxy-6-metoxy-1,4-benzoquinol methylase